VAKRTRSDDLEALQKVNDAETLARNAMKDQVRMWGEAEQAMQNKVPVTDPYSPNVTVGRLAADMETIVPRDVQSLMGNRPYMPYGATDKNNPGATDYASGITDNVDYYTETGKLYTKFADLMRIVRPKGIAYIEPRWSLFPLSIYDRQVETDALGRVVSVSEFYEDGVEEGVEFRILDPEAVRPHPYGNDLDSKPEICVVELVHKNEIKRLLDSKGSGYSAPAGVKEDQLFTGMGDGVELQQQTRRDKGNLTGDAYKDVGVLIRRYAEDRWTHTWNRQWVLMDTENHNKNMPKCKKPFAAFRNMSHIGMDRYWPVGDFEFMMDLYWLGDMWLNMYAKAAQMYGAQWIMFNPDSGLSANDLKPIAGARVPVPGGDFDRAVRAFKMNEPPAAYLEFYRENKTNTDNRIHINDWVAGRDPVRKETATAVEQLSSAGLTNLEFGVTYIEQGGLSDLAYLTGKTVAANQSGGQRAKILGWERSQRILSADPEAIPGGYTLNFKGSDRVQREQSRMDKRLQGYNLTRGQATILEPWMMDREILSDLGYENDKLDAMGLTAEAQQAFRQQQMAALQPPPPPMGSVGAESAIMNPSQVGMAA